MQKKLKKLWKFIFLKPVAYNENKSSSNGNLEWNSKILDVYIFILVVIIILAISHVIF